LESWGDAQPKAGHFYIQQPTIRPLFKTRAAGESFLMWAGVAENTDTFYRDFIKKQWNETVFKAQGTFQGFQAFWDNALFDGFVVTGSVSPKVEQKQEKKADKKEEKKGEKKDQPKEETKAEEKAPAPAASGSVAEAAANLPKPQASGLEMVLYETVNMGAGQFANNPWLQEMPDPILRTTWDNFLSIPIKWNGDNDYISLGNMKDGDIAMVKINGVEYRLPVVRQFGQLENTLAVGLGYGRKIAGLAGSNVGVDLFPAVSVVNNTFQYHTVAEAEPQKVGRDSIFAAVQMHHTYGLKNKMEGSDKVINVDEQVLGHRGFQGSLTNRSVVFQGTAATFAADLEHLKEKREEYQHLNAKGLYPGHEDWYKMGHHWAMAVDLNACIGCGACTVACMAENNVPVVGKYEVAIAHEMTWLRIDRYFYGTEETPNTVYQPMMCQHCENAPCENVCPVAATNHSSEGINQMTYNRCIGTRYCANNCPFKVRRFNWLDYTSADVFPSNEVDMNRGKDGEYYTYMTDNLTRMVLNPDVTVRSRGVIEKCSFCIQRIQEGKLKAKVEGRKLKDGDVKSACQQACPTGAIVFGDRNDKNSEVWKLMNTQRAYIPLEETNVGSSVTYLMKVTNKDESFNA
jgi:molybdopterin-containing oxidoreductase family iron-sulfur binding subunit